MNVGAALAATPSRASSLLHRSEVLATFRKRGPYQLQAQVRKKGQPLQTRTFETRAEVEQWARLIEVEMDKGVFVSSRAEAESTPLKDPASILRPRSSDLAAPACSIRLIRLIRRLSSRVILRVDRRDRSFTPARQRLSLGPLLTHLGYRNPC